MPSSEPVLSKSRSRLHAAGESASFALALLTRSPRLLQAAQVTFATLLVRLIHALSALALTYAFGTSPTTDRYMAFTMAVVSACTIASIALPSLAGAFISRRGCVWRAQAPLRQWGWRHAGGAMAMFLVCSPVLAWLMTSRGPHLLSRAWELEQLMLIASPCIGLAVLNTVEQSLLQAKGRLTTGVWAGGWNTVATASFLALGAALGDVRWAAAGLVVGAVAEGLWLRRCNKLGQPVGLSENVLPAAATPVATYKPWLALTLASLASFVVGPLDQIWLADLGPRAQAVWGLGSRVPSFLTLSVYAVVSVFSTVAAAQWGQDRVASARHSLKLAAVALLACVVLLGLVAWQAQPLVVALYERGSFSAHDSVATAGALRDALWAYVLYPMSVALVRGASLAGCQRALWGSAALFLGAKVAVAAWAVPVWGLSAIAVSTFIATAAQSAVLVCALWPQSVLDRRGTPRPAEP